ncbi:hypothetical protein TKWG_06525 [Advenella kashmirensis WT001]|uniref:Uncharacterized protein n=1 Tax=Advenella kashmirensis (strain DSM 17095 / LMG 22695 / WT001) TaxID=1036672 RepID=I3U9Q8_ADVKW|nr:hypothetical protein TKWG_06525 [Advenella kashmirensis WT001]
MCLAAMAFVCRSVIPSGYMPVLSGDNGRTVVLTLCNADGGNETLLLSIPKQSQESPSQDHAGQECPFGLVVSQAILPILGSPALPVTVWQQRLAPFVEHNQALPALPALGPPLGSRAPPFLLG